MTNELLGSNIFLKAFLRPVRALKTFFGLKELRKQHLWSKRAF